MNFKLTGLAAVSAIGLGTSAFAEPIECQFNYWCELPVETTAESLADILYGNEWGVSLMGDRVFVSPTGDLDTLVIVPVEDGIASFEVMAMPNPAWVRELSGATPGMNGSHADCPKHSTQPDQ